MSEVGGRGRLDKSGEVEGDGRMRGGLMLVTGGARSGKSGFAQDVAGRLGGKVFYVATCVPQDDEMHARVVAHRLRRPADWRTIEEPVDVAAVLDAEGANADVIIVDCLGLLVTNLLLRQDERLARDLRCGAIVDSVRTLATVAREVPAHVVVVSNEAGMGLVPETPLGRLFQDALGWSNQVVAGLADEVYLMVAGIPVEIKSLSRPVGAAGSSARRSGQVNGPVSPSTGGSGEGVE